MAIPTLAEVKAAVSAEEIASYEVAIKEYLETPGIVTYLEDTAITNKVLSRTFLGKELTVPGIAALKASITAAGWTNAVVENQPSPAADGIGRADAQPGRQVFVSFKPAAVTPPAPSGNGNSSGGSGS